MLSEQSMHVYLSFWWVHSEGIPCLKMGGAERFPIDEHPPEPGE